MPGRRRRPGRQPPAAPLSYPWRGTAARTANHLTKTTTHLVEGVVMTYIESVTLEVPDPAAAEAFYTAAFGLGDRVRLRASQAPTTGFRGFMLSLVVSQPSTVDALVGTALDAGATMIKPVKKSLWGYGGSLRAPDGTIWKI